MVGQVDMSGVILAGGRSRRIGKDKAFLRIGRSTIIERILASIKPIFKETFIVAKDTEKFRRFGVKVIKDISVYQSPLIGIYTALKISKFPRCFIFACDMPFLNKDLILYMATKAKGSDCIMLEDAKGLHPLHAIYSKKCINAAEKHLCDKDFRASDIAKFVKTRRINYKTLSGLKTEKTSLFNINTISDLKKSRRLFIRFSNTNY